MMPLECPRFIAVSEPMRALCILLAAAACKRAPTPGPIEEQRRIADALSSCELLIKALRAAEVAAEVRQEAEAAAEEPLKPDEGDTVTTEALIEDAELRRDNTTLVILILILLQLGLTLYLGWFSWWSLTGILWLVVGLGVYFMYGRFHSKLRES